MGEPDLDLILYGATGFAGRQAARYLAERGPADLRWAVAGRSAERLEAVRAGLDPAVRERVAVVVADSGDPAAVDAMVARGRAVLTTAGPFARYGTPVVAACVARGVDYVDITGETPWVRDLIDRFHGEAAARGVRIVPCCGFDSVPSDLGTWLVADWIRRTWDQPTRLVRGAFAAGGGGLNGGTLASALAMGEAGRLEELNDPFLLSPPGQRGDPARVADRKGVEWDPDLERWLAPFFMAPINTRVVRRSAGLLAEAGSPYGEPFRYDEALETRSRLRAWGFAAGMAAAEPFLRRRLGRRLLGRLGPEPGQGPSEEAMARGWFRCRLLGVAADGRKALGEVSGQGDPGNRATVTFLCEAALALVRDREALPDRAGILTPATAFDGVLAERLRERAGYRVEVGSLSP